MSDACGDGEPGEEALGFRRSEVIRAAREKWSRQMAETEIHQRVADWAQAVRAKSIDAVMAFYAPEIVSFDLDPPLRYAGTANKRRAWQAFFAAHPGPVGYEVCELQTATEGALAFAHSLNHASGQLANGRKTDLWVRWTAAMRRVGGLWLITHDHVSVPAVLDQGKAALDLIP